MKQQSSLDRFLNLGWTAQSNTTTNSSEIDLPNLSCHTEIIPDFLALYNEPGHYQEAGLRTGICFYLYDNEFDGIHGLFNAIYYQDSHLLSYYRRRFAGVRIFITPDYSQFGDVHFVENAYRLFKAAIVSIWLTNNLHAVVIPSITGANETLLRMLLNSLRDCSVVAFSTKGHMSSQPERERLRRMIRVTVNTLDLKTIVVYDCCTKDDQTLQLFSYATQCGIRIVIPDNTLKRRNQLRSGVTL